MGRVSARVATVAVGVRNRCNVNGAVVAERPAPITSPAGGGQQDISSGHVSLSALPTRSSPANRADRRAPLINTSERLADGQFSLVA